MIQSEIVFQSDGLRDADSGVYTRPIILPLAPQQPRDETPAAVPLPQPVRAPAAGGGITVNAPKILERAAIIAGPTPAAVRAPQAPSTRTTDYRPYIVAGYSLAFVLVLLLLLDDRD